MRKSFAKLKKSKHRLALIAFGALLFLAGISLRLFTLGSEMISGDEWHALNLIETFSYSDFVTQFHWSHSTSMGLYYEVLNHFKAISTLSVRFFSILSSTALLILVPYLLRKKLTVPALLFLSACLCFSVFLIYYARFARPYELITLLVFLHTMALYAYFKNPRFLLAIASVFLACCSAYTMVVVLPFLIASYLVVIILSFSDKRRLKRMFFLAMISGGMILASYLPYGESFFGAEAHNIQKASLSLNSVLTALGLLVTNHTIPLVWLGFLFLWVYGIYAQRKDSFTLLLVVPIVIQITFVISTKPLASEGPHIFARYVLIILPAIVYLISQGFNELINRAGFNRKGGLWASVVISTLLIITSPAWPVIVSNYPHKNVELLVHMANLRDLRPKLKSNIFTGTHFPEVFKPEDDNRFLITPFFTEDYLAQVDINDSDYEVKMIQITEWREYLDRHTGILPKPEPCRALGLEETLRDVLKAREYHWLVIRKQITSYNHGKQVIPTYSPEGFKIIRQQLGPPDFRDSLFVLYNLQNLAERASDRAK